MKPFPTDDATLLAVQHALGGAYTVDEDGTHHLVGATYSMNQLLDFLSGFDPQDSVLVSDDGNTEIYEHTKPIYSLHDVISALVEELLKCRAAS